MMLRTAIQGMFGAVILTAGLAGAQEAPVAPSVARQAMSDAWFTGPMLAPSASTLPRGHFLIEPYLFDVTTQGRYDRDGTRHSAPHANQFGSLTYMLYGVANRVTVGLIPTAGYSVVSGGPSSSGVGIGDLTAQAQYRLTQFQEGRWIPTVSVAVQQTFPTGKYDRLGNRPSDGLGSGAYSTTLALYSQRYFWLPNHRILRARLNVTEAFPRNVDLQDVSVYGTEAGFRGHAAPGRTFFVDTAFEYSATRKWVLALDVTYRHDGNTLVAGYNASDPSAQGMAAVRMNSGISEAFGFAPAIEYNWKRNLGVLVGTRLIGPGRNTSATTTPAVAINYVH